MQLTDELYKENILDHYRHPHNKKGLANATSRHREYNESCGDDIEVFLHIEQDIIKDITFQGSGCAISQAAISMLTDELQGKTIQQANNISEEDVLLLLGIEVGVSRRKCAMLGRKAIQAALREKL